MERLNEIAIAGCLPDLTVLLRIDPDGRRVAAASSAWRRVARTAPTASRDEGIEFQRLVAAAYDDAGRPPP